MYNLSYLFTTLVSCKEFRYRIKRKASPYASSKIVRTNLKHVVSCEHFKLRLCYPMSPEIVGTLAPKVGFLLVCLFLIFGRKTQNSEPMMTAILGHMFFRGLS